MKAILLFRSVDASKGYVSGYTPLTYSSIKSDAYKIEFDPLDDIDADFVESKVWNVLNALIDQSGVLKWFMHIESDKEEPISTIMIEDGRIAIGTPDEVDRTLARQVRELCTMLADYLMSKSLERLASGTATSLPPSDTASVSSAPPKESDSDSELTEFVKRIEEKTKVTITKPKETLSDYVCNDLLKAELEEVKDFFENKKVYDDAGIKLPVGILFKGVPGTGKTYAARCIAGSIDCYFMSCTASSLQGMYIGSGAENIRNVFNGAKVLREKSGKGVIVFIDELDSFGSRESHSGSSSDESDRTLNQLLAEMSGFSEVDGIMVLGATNYPERIDDALMRSGRFSRQITIDIPDDYERFKLVEYYFQKLNMHYTDECTAEAVAALTVGLTPADICEIVNEAGILTIRAKSPAIDVSSINEAVNKVITKNIRKPDKSEEFHNLVAVHEAGHVLAEYLYKNEFSVKVTNYSYGDAGGFTQPRKSNTGIVSKEDYLNDIRCLLGGRAAEEVMLGKISTGASEDFSRAVRKIKAYYTTYFFEKYEVSNLDQLVQDKLNELYEACCEEFRMTNVHDALEHLTAALNTERILYTLDISRIITKHI